MNNTNQILIEKYIEGTLTAQELTDFEFKLTTDAQFAQEVNDLKDFVAAVQVFGRNELKQELQAIAEAEPLPQDVLPPTETTNSPEKKLRRVGRSYRRLIGIAAAILLAATPIMLLNSRQASPEKLFAGYFKAYPNVEAPIVRDATNKTPLEQALFTYEKKDYNNAIRQLIKIKPTDKNQEAVMFYLAMSHLASSNAPEAIKHFKMLQTQTVSGTYQKQTQWYLAMAYLVNKEIESCKNILKLLTKEENFYQKKAGELLEKLK